MLRQAVSQMRGAAAGGASNGGACPGPECAVAVRADRNGNANSAGRKGDLVLQRFTRPHDDACDAATRVHQATRPGAYALASMLPAKAGVLAVERANPVIAATPGYGGPNQAAINTDSQLRILSTEEGRWRVPLHVQARPFTTVPYMGGGRGNADVESALIHSSDVHVERSCGSATELEFPYATPLIPQLKHFIQRPANLITEVASPGWVFGGISSRTLMRDLATDC
jgi:hypothetical protein